MGPQDDPLEGNGRGSPDVVLDTNAILALWWFHDPAVAPLAQAVESRALRWWATPGMRAELAHVLGRLPWRSDEDRARLLLASFDRWARVAPQPPRAARLRCTDPDDQMFLDLAVDRRASWLFSRDRALLRLRRRAAIDGLSIRVPEHWAPPPRPR